MTLKSIESVLVYFKGAIPRTASRIWKAQLSNSKKDCKLFSAYPHIKKINLSVLLPIINKLKAPLLYRHEIFYIVAALQGSLQSFLIANIRD